MIASDPRYPKVMNPEIGAQPFVGTPMRVRPLRFRLTATSAKEKVQAFSSRGRSGERGKWVTARVGGE
jgi:hypothetical protein